jgi:hypothetical protein
MHRNALLHILADVEQRLALCEAELAYRRARLDRVGQAADRVQIIKHEAVPKCSSYEVRFSDGRPSKYFYWEDIPGPRLRSDQLDSQQALEEAKAFARAESDRT